MLPVTVVRGHPDSTGLLSVTENSRSQRRQHHCWITIAHFPFLLFPISTTFVFIHRTNPFLSSQYSWVAIGPRAGTAEFLSWHVPTLLADSMFTSPEFSMSYFKMSWLNWRTIRKFPGFSPLIVSSCLTTLPALFLLQSCWPLLRKWKKFSLQRNTTQATPINTSKEERETLTWKKGRGGCVCLHTHSYFVSIKPKEMTHSPFISGLRKF